MAVRAFSSVSLTSAFDISTASKASPWMIQEPSSQRDSPTRMSDTCTRLETSCCNRSSWTTVGPDELKVGGVSRTPGSQRTQERDGVRDEYREGSQRDQGREQQGDQASPAARLS